MAGDPRGGFGRRVRALRLARGISQEELADRAGVHRTYLGGVERGERNPSLRNITRIAGALGVRTEELFYVDSRRRGYGEVAEPHGSFSSIGRALGKRRQGRKRA